MIGVKISELAKRSGVSARSLRYYEQQKLLSPSRDRAGHRIYDVCDVERVVEIQELFAAGFCSAGIRDLLPGIFDPAPGSSERLSERLRHGHARLRRELRKIERELEVLTDLQCRLGLDPHTDVRAHTDEMSSPTPQLPPPRQLRLIVETSDFDEAVRFYRDVLGMPEQPAFATTGDDRVSILHAGTATIELATPQHVVSIDHIEAAPQAHGPTLRLALEVDNIHAALEATDRAGVTWIAGPVETPFRSLNARVQGPGGWQVTLFHELESLEQRASREGFATDDQRAR